MITSLKDGYTFDMDFRATGFKSNKWEVQSGVDDTVWDNYIDSFKWKGS